MRERQFISLISKFKASLKRRIPPNTKRLHNIYTTSAQNRKVRFNIAGNLLDREVACSASDRQCSNFESCVWRVISSGGSSVSSHTSHHPQEVLLARFTLLCAQRLISFHFFETFSILRQIIFFLDIFYFPGQAQQLCPSLSLGYEGPHKAVWV